MNMNKYQVPTDNYFCVINGNEVKKYGANKKPIMRVCEKEAAKGNYVELWYCYTTGEQTIINYWN